MRLQVVLHVFGSCQCCYYWFLCESARFSCCTCAWCYTCFWQLPVVLLLVFLTLNGEPADVFPWQTCVLSLIYMPRRPRRFICDLKSSALSLPYAAVQQKLTYETTYNSHYKCTGKCLQCGKKFFVIFKQTEIKVPSHWKTTACFDANPICIEYWLFCYRPLRWKWNQSCAIRRAVVVPERGGTPLRQIFWSRNGAPVNVVGHRRNANTVAFRQIR